MSNDINEEVIVRTSPECGVIRISAEFQSCPDEERPKGQSPLTRTVNIRPNQTEDELLPKLKVVPGKFIASFQNRKRTCTILIF